MFVDPTLRELEFSVLYPEFLLLVDVLELLNPLLNELLLIRVEFELSLLLAFLSTAVYSLRPTTPDLLLPPIVVLVTADLRVSLTEVLELPGLL